MSARVHGPLWAAGALPLTTAHGRFRVRLFRNLRTRAPALLLERGDVASAEPLLARVHSSCVTSETFGGCDCDCAGQLDAALARIAREDRGVVLYLMQEGRGAGFLAKARDRMLVQASDHRLTTFEAYERMGLGRDRRRYDEVASALALSGIRAPLVLLSNNPDKIRALEREGLRVRGVEGLEPEWSSFNLHYVASKRRSGHALVEPPRPPPRALLPEPVVELEPRPLPGAPHLLHVATYLLPVLAERGGSPLWLRLHAHLDRRTGGERVAFTYGARAHAGTPVAVQHESLLERFPPARDALPRSRREAWRRTLARFAAAGSGVAVFVPAPDPALPTAASGQADAASRALLQHYAPERAGRDARGAPAP